MINLYCKIVRNPRTLWGKLIQSYNVKVILIGGAGQEHL